jgi:hypothetical protein
VDKLDEVLGCCEDDMRRCDGERSAILGKKALVGVESTRPGQGNDDLLLTVSAIQ